MKHFARRILTIALVGIACLIGLQACFTIEAEPPSEPAANAPVAQTKAVTVTDVLAADIPSPTLSRVSFPAFSYTDAFGNETGDEPILEITSFQQAPMLDDLDAMPADIRGHFPETLPPVAERLPRNPAVVRGPNGVGNYGGTWRRSTTAYTDMRRKIGYESFVRFDPSGKLQPCLAYRWEVSDNNRVFTFYLRKGHRWSDGEPFTAHDVVWVCNKMFGSDFRPNLPNWMQREDGTARLYVDEILDWRGFQRSMHRQFRAGLILPGPFFLDAGGQTLRDTYRKLETVGEPSEALKHEFVAQLNAAFQTPLLTDYEKLQLAGSCFDQELESLNHIGYSRLSPNQAKRFLYLLEIADLYRKAKQDINSLDSTRLSRLNLAIFRGAFGRSVAPAEIRRVKVEAVPDRKGDTSHIVRFTFPKPNAIFLEKTATFMFYLDAFDYAKHFTGPLHPDGSGEFCMLDVYDWANLFATVRRQGTANEPSPGRQLWTRLSKEIRTAIAADPPDDSSPPEYKRQLVDAINAALTSRSFYTAKAWDGVELGTEWQSLTADGFSGQTKGNAWRRRIGELLDRADLLRRVGVEGIESLNDADVYRLNLAMLRAAFGGAEGEAPLANNREDALNTAARNHPRRYTTWAFRLRRLHSYDPKGNPHFPTLRAWRVISEPEDTTLLAVRNPYYYRVDTAGNQLPYIDQVHTNKEPRKSNILMSMTAGSIDFQVRDIAFEDYTYLKAHEKRGGYEVRLWANDYCGEVVFMPLQPHKDAAYAQLQETSAFRHALSLAINRQEIIDTVYAGIGTPAQCAVPVGSPYYSDFHAKMSIEYDPDRANALLDEMGLDRRNSAGTRLLPDGRPLIMNLDTQAERPLNVVQMVCEYWRRIGIDARMHVRTYKALTQMSGIGIIDIRVHKEGGNYFGPLMAGGYAPTHPAEAVQWYNWAEHIRSGGRRGWQPPERMMEVQRMWEKVLVADDDQGKFEAWNTLAERTARDLPVIGVMTSPGKLVYVRNNFKNVPKLALAGWIAHDPGNCCPEAFFFDPPQ